MAQGDGSGTIVPSIAMASSSGIGHSTNRTTEPALSPWVLRTAAW